MTIGSVNLSITSYGKPIFKKNFKPGKIEMVLPYAEYVFSNNKYYAVGVW